MPPPLTATTGGRRSGRVTKVRTTPSAGAGEEGSLGSRLRRRAPSAALKTPPPIAATPAAPAARVRSCRRVRGRDADVGVANLLTGPAGRESGYLHPERLRRRRTSAARGAHGARSTRRSLTR